MAEYVKKPDHDALYIVDWNDDLESFEADDIRRYRFVYWDDVQGEWTSCDPLDNDAGGVWSLQHPPPIQTNYSAYPWQHCADCMGLTWDDYLCSDCRARNYPLSVVEQK